MIEERLLGFDARERPNELGSLWPPDRRALFLLRSDVAIPLSVDTLVWPSVFDTGQGIGLPGPQRKALRLAGLPLPPYTGPNAGLWEDASSLRRYLSERRGEIASCVMIAVSWFPSAGGSFGPYPTSKLPGTPDSGWQRLGFDVADGSQLSGLSNCGYLAEEAEHLRVDWTPRLNESHLFDDPDLAMEFCALTDARVPSHAPFYVYGLYLVEGLD
jgi:hypothetical protein